MLPFWSSAVLIIVFFSNICYVKNDFVRARNFRHQEIQLSKKCQDTDCFKIKLSFAAYNHTFDIDLVRNDKLFADDYIEMYDDTILNDESNGRSIAARDLCYYISSPTSLIQASLSLCNDQIQGFIVRSRVIYIIRYDHEESSHCIYRESDLPQFNLKCGNTEFSSQFREFQRNEFEHLNPKVVSSPRVSYPLMKYVEWVLVIDSAAYKKRFNSDPIHMRNEVLKILNHVSGFYLKIDFHILLKALIVWDKKDRIKPDSSLDPFVRNFIRYNENDLYPQLKQDTATLLTGRTFKENDLLGFSTKGFTCNAPEIAAGASVYKPDMSNEFISIIIAHEMGHTLGFDDEYYDQQGNCRGGCETDLCIMSGKITSPTHEWSKCTKTVVKRRTLDQRYNCLYNVPLQKNYPIPVCMNGIIEGEEECDCSISNTDCQACCQDCKLTQGSKCSSGQCCRNCQIISSGFSCRPARDSSCDITDLCDGVSEHCEDRFKPNFNTTCESNFKWCIEGRCEFKCLHNCSSHGACVQRTDMNVTLPQGDFVCQCYEPFYGKFCQHKVSLQKMILFHLLSGFIIFIISFLLTYLTIVIVDKYLRKK